MATEGHRLALAGLAAMALAGCRPGAEPVFDTFASSPVRYAPATGSRNAFDAYCLAALSAEQVGGKDFARVTFSADERQAALKTFAPYLRQIEEASTYPCQFEFTPRTPFDAIPYVRGWRLLGNCLCWEIQQEVAAGDYNAAVSHTVSATRFGFDLTGGGAVEATVGLTIVDDARKALLVGLDQLSAEQLRRLGEGLRRALEQRPPLSQTIANEEADTLQGIQSLEDHYREGSLGLFQVAYGPDAREPLEYLQNLSPSDPKRSEFFRTLKDYAVALDAYALRLADAPVVARAKIAAPTIPSDRAWHRLAKYLVRAPLPLIEINDVSLARTRLFVLTAELKRRTKTGLPLPANLDAFTKPLSIDPFTGAPFIYRSDTEEFRVYSVGKDGLDNAGQTDGAFLEPDLTLEKG